MDPNETNQEVTDVAPEKTIDSNQADSQPGTTESTDTTPAEASTGTEGDSTTAAWDVSLWDGTADSLPEEFRPLYQRVSTDYERQLTEFRERETDMEDLRRLYQNMVNDNADPRVEELTAKAAALEAEKNEIKTKYDEIEQQYKTESERLHAVREQYAEEKLADYKKRHAWIFESEENEKSAIELMDEGWGPEQVPVIMKLTPEKQQKARERMKKNPAAAEEIILWVTASGAKTVTDNADLVSGASTPQITSTVAPVKDKPNMSHREQIEAAAARNIDKRLKAGKARRR